MIIFKIVCVFFAFYKHHGVIMIRFTGIYDKCFWYETFVNPLTTDLDMDSPCKKERFRKRCPHKWVSFPWLHKLYRNSLVGACRQGIYVWKELCLSIRNQFFRSCTNKEFACIGCIISLFAKKYLIVAVRNHLVAKWPVIKKLCVLTVNTSSWSLTQCPDRVSLRYEWRRALPRVVAFWDWLRSRTGSQRMWPLVQYSGSGQCLPTHKCQFLLSLPITLLKG